jgi:hypothetical protein
MAQAPGGFFEQVRFWVTDRPGGGGAPAAGQGYAMSTEEMTTELGKLERLWENIEVQKEKAKPMASIVSPGLDQASLRNTEACNTSGRYYLGHLDRQSQYLGTIIDKMHTALGITGRNDEQVAEDVTNQSGGHI